MTFNSSQAQAVENWYRHFSGKPEAMAMNTAPHSAIPCRYGYPTHSISRLLRADEKCPESISRWVCNDNYLKWSPLFVPPNTENKMEYQCLIFVI
jgi:hypothetical protein